VSSHLISVMTAAVVGRCATAWQRLVGPPARNGASYDGERSTMKVRELTWQSGAATVWPVEWVDWADAGGASDVPESGVLEGFTRLGNRLLLRINVNGSRRTAGLEWDPPPSVDDVEAVLQANLGAQILVIGQLDVPIRARLDSSA
jgi:hypothetical protein